MAYGGASSSLNEINLISPLGERFSRRIITPAYHQAIRERWLTDYAEASKGCVHLLDLVEVEQHASREYIEQAAS
jgi:hypothetical protein